ncbi:hypothetical protein [Pararhodonellum marinum]|uniref:hypothetical protein n=1 Tax=Pararhodonellum marinum TaxID=2755358 RepID=UPI00188F70CD|nr:hypothetical protein [Pararhodonellum marinum]
MLKLIFDVLFPLTFLLDQKSNTCLQQAGKSQAGTLHPQGPTHPRFSGDPPRGLWNDFGLKIKFADFSSNK